MATAEREVQVRNRLGMHARAAVRFVQIANAYRSEVKVVKDGVEANGKSIMGLLTLVAAHGVVMTIVCEGEDAQAAVAALAELVDSGFGEGVDPLTGVEG
jgi:phosphocarrier protein HPr